MIEIAEDGWKVLGVFQKGKWRRTYTTREEHHHVGGKSTLWCEQNYKTWLTLIEGILLDVFFPRKKRTNQFSVFSPKHGSSIKNWISTFAQVFFLRKVKSSFGPLWPPSQTHDNDRNHSFCKTHRLCHPRKKKKKEA